MNRFSNIFFYADESPWVAEALRQAIALARQTKARLAVCGVIQRVTQEIRFPDRIIRPSEIEHALRMDCLDELTELLKKAGGAEEYVRKEVLAGAPAQVVVRAAIEGGYDLLVKGAQGRSDPMPLLFSSVDMQMLRRCPCPVWMVKPNRQGRCRQILAAVGLQPPNGEDEDLDAIVLDIGASLAAVEGAELHVLDVWKRGTEAAITGARLGFSQADARRWLKNTRKAQEPWLADLVADIMGSRTKAEPPLVTENANHFISTVAAKLGVDLIVMATATPKGIRGFFIGSTAEQVLGQVQCSILAVKPAMFKEVARDGELKQLAN